MNLVPLTISPAFITASIYLCLSRIVTLYDPTISVSRLKPLTYSYIFVTADIISLILQAAGGAIAAIANDKKTSNLGVNVMIAGLAFQVVSVALFILICLDFGWRLKRSGAYRPIHSGTHARAAEMKGTKRLFGFLICKFVQQCDQAQVLTTVHSSWRGYRSHIRQMRLPPDRTPRRV